MLSERRQSEPTITRVHCLKTVYRTWCYKVETGQNFKVEEEENRIQGDLGRYMCKAEYQIGGHKRERI